MPNRNTEDYEIVESTPVVVDIRIVKGTIQDNFGAIKAELRKMMAKYKTMVYTENDIAKAKDDLAMLRKKLDNAEDARKAAKRDWDAPYEEWKKMYDSLAAEIKEPIALIDAQLKEFEKKRIEEKKLAIQTWIEEEAEALGEDKETIRPLLAYDTRWENKTNTEFLVRKDIKAQFKAKQDEMDNIRQLCTGEDEYMLPQLMAAYKRTADLGYCMRYRAQLVETRENLKRQEEAKKAAAEEKRKAEEEAKIAKARADEEAKARAEMEKRLADEEARRRAELDQSMNISQVEPELNFNQSERPTGVPKTMTFVVSFSIRGTAQQLKQINAYLKSIDGLVLKTITPPHPANEKMEA